MNRKEFMKQLEALLQNISFAEREEALQYYNDYFDDAGPENEQSVIEALGNPARVAENIKRDLSGSSYGDGVYQRVSPTDKAVIPYGQSAAYENSSSQEKKLSDGMIALIAVLCVIGSPAIFGIVSGVFGILLGIVAAWFSLILAFGIVAVVLFVVFLVLLLLGIMSILSEPLAGVGLMGAGMLCGGLGMLFLMLTVAMAGIVTPAVCRGMVSLFQRCRAKYSMQKK